jgi:hypothetical protein
MTKGLSLIVPPPIIHKSGVSKIDQRGDSAREHTGHIPLPRCFAVVKSLERQLTVAGAFAIHGKATRKRTYVSRSPVPQIFVVDDEAVIASILAAILKMNGLSAKFFQPARYRC